MTLSIRWYQVEGDLTADKSSEAYPLIMLCEECVASYNVIVEEGTAEGPCEDCGRNCNNEE